MDADNKKAVDSKIDGFFEIGLITGLRGLRSLRAWRRFGGLGRGRIEGGGRHDAGGIAGVRTGSLIANLEIGQSGGFTVLLDLGRGGDGIVRGATVLSVMVIVLPVASTALRVPENFVFLGAAVLLAVVVPVAVGVAWA